jgi:hypothetical protein
MGKLSLTFVAVGVAACGNSNNNNSVDAHVVVPDTKPIDAPKVFLDAPPSTYNFACAGMTAPATAPADITLAGTTETFNGMALSNLAGVSIQAFKNGNLTALDTQTSDANGAFTTAGLPTGGVPLDGYIKASLATYRTTYVYPPNVVSANLAAIPVPLISQALIDQYNAVLNQNDTNNGLLFLTVADCSLMPIMGATLTVKQGTASVGQILDVGTLASQFAGLYIVSNVPDGDTTIGASYNAMTFPTHVVTAHKKPGDANAVGTVTASAVVPGYF